MNIIKPGDLSKVNSTVKRFVCSACGCEWEAEKTEYFYECSVPNLPIVCQCPTCNRVVTNHMYDDGSVIKGERIEMCRTCENWQKDKNCLLARCAHYKDCTHDGFIHYKRCKRHDLD